jgi:hypothetical protein
MYDIRHGKLVKKEESLSLNDFGKDIVRRGGHDDASDDDQLLMELMARAPGMTKEEYAQCFVALLEQYGEDALLAIRSGAVKFEERK